MMKEFVYETYKTLMVVHRTEQSAGQLIRTFNTCLAQYGALAHKTGMLEH